MAVLGLGCCVGLSLGAGHGLEGTQASAVAGQGSIAAAGRLNSCGAWA